MKSKKHKKHHHHHRNKAKAKRRNDAGGGAFATTTRRPRLRRAAPPPWQTIGAAVAGSVGSAIASGLLVNQEVAKPDTVALLMAATGGLGAYLTDGNARVAFTGVAAAGAGQFALVKLGHLAEKKAQKEADEKAKADAAAQPQQALPAPSGSAPRQQASGRGVVVDLFRDAAADLEELDDDEVRYSPRDAVDDEDDDTPIEIELDEAA